MCACFSSETDEMALGFENGDVKIFDTLAKNFQMKQNYEIHNSPITCMILNSEFLISGTEIGDIIVYKFQDASKKCLNMHSLGVTCLAWFNEDSMMMSGSKDKQVCIWELAVCSFTVLPLIHFDRVLCGTVTENSCYGITGSADNTIVV